MYNFNVGSSYTFNTVAPGILGVIVINAKLIGVIDYDTAITYSPVNVMFRQIYPLLPAGTPNNPTTTSYYRFLTTSGAYLVLAGVWIDQNTVVLVDNININVTVPNASIGDMVTLRNLLNSSGYTGFTITQI